MKKAISLSLLILFLSCTIYAQGQHNYKPKEGYVPNEAANQISVKAELVKYDKSIRPSRDIDGAHVIYDTNVARFRIIEPKEYAGKIINIETFNKDELDANNFESKSGVLYSFDVPSGSYGRIERKYIHNFKEISK